MTAIRVVVVTTLALLSAATATAQSADSAPSWRPWRPVVSLGGAWAGAEDLGTVSADTRATGLGTLTPPSFPLFRTESTLEAGPRAELAIALPVTGAIALELVGASARPTLATAISRDAESAPAATASERIDEYTVGARLLYEVDRWRFAGRARPYLAAGGAYLRQLHEDHVLVETGQVWSAAAGVRAWLRGGRGRGIAVGITGEAGWNWRRGGIAFTDGSRNAPSASLRLFAGF